MAACKVCRLPIERITRDGILPAFNTWVVVDTGTTADGISYCPPDPNGTGPISDHEPQALVTVERIEVTWDGCDIDPCQYTAPWLVGDRMRVCSQHIGDAVDECAAKLTVA